MPGDGLGVARLRILPERVLSALAPQGRNDDGGGAPPASSNYDEFLNGIRR